MAGVRSAAAGWYMAKTSAAFAPVAGSTGRTVPCACEIRAPGMNVPIEKRPSVTTTAGSRTSSCRRRYGAQAAISSGCGSRLSGGRHLTTLVMKTSSRRQPIDASSLTSRSPARPTNGRPSRSSLKPGPSPTKTTSVSGSPSPGTALRPRLVQAAVRADPDLGGDLLERRPALGVGHAVASGDAA